MASSMNDTELNKIADAWIAGEEGENDSPAREANWWAIERVMDWSIEGEDELLWQFILIVYNRNISEKVAALLAAGPLEDLLAYHGPKFIDQVEELARKDDKFNWLLGGVWRNDMTDEVWQRVQDIRKQIW